ncbi:MAG: hypothetical protein RLZZ15_3272 [Verrucomicrobiota bacterium]
MNNFLINLPILLLSLALLWLPRSWLRFGVVKLPGASRRRRSRATSEPWRKKVPGDKSLDFRTEFGKLRNYVDFLRAGTGAFFLMGLTGIDPCVQLAPGAPRGYAVGLMAAKSIVFIVAVVLQTARYHERRLTFFPPVFFLAGLSIGLCSPFAALAAFVLIWAFNPLFASAEGFLPIYGVLTVVFGNWFLGIGDRSSILQGALCLLPVLLSLMTRRPLVVFSKRDPSNFAPS